MLEGIKSVLISELDCANLSKEVPIAAVIIFNNKILCSAHNQRIEKNDVTAHAEVLAIREAAKIIGDWRLSECDLYITLEPCAMCREIIKESRIRNVYYFVKRTEDKKSFNKTIFAHIDEDGEKSFQQYLSDFFKDNCNR